MDNVFASIVSGVITANTDDKILLCNREPNPFLDGAGLSLLVIIWMKSFHRLIMICSIMLGRSRQKDQQIVGLEFKSTLPQRGAVTLSFNLSPLKDALHSTQGVAIVLDDLTEKKRLEAQRRLFERMVSPAVIEQLDPDKLQLGGNELE